jgi:hypothetical protein
MLCPQCKTPYKCTCDSCDPEHKITTWTMLKDEDCIRCNTCGLTQPEGWWLDEEVRQLCEETGTKSLTEAIEVLDKQREEASHGA